MTYLTTNDVASKYRPMLMQASAQAFSRQGWLFEPKMDGMRGVAIVKDRGVMLMSRNALDFAQRYPALASEVAGISKDIVLDGEIVAFDAQGKPSFERLQERIIMSREREIVRADITNPVHYFVFDIMEWQGKDLTQKPLRERKKYLRDAVAPSSLIKVIDSFETDGEMLFNASASLGLEGIVCKDSKSQYQCGIRSKHWVKVKHTITADVVIAGHRKEYGFLVGVWDDEARTQLRFVGNVLGGLRGEDYEYLDRNLTLLEKCPFKLPTQQIRRWNALWFAPRIMAEVKFMHWTSGGFLRMPSFTRLRLV